jgi:hypothetical protein
LSFRELFSHLLAHPNVVVNGQYKLRQNTKVTVTLPTPVVAKQVQAS